MSGHVSSDPTWPGQLDGHKLTIFDSASDGKAAHRPAAAQIDNAGRVGCFVEVDEWPKVRFEYRENVQSRRIEWHKTLGQLLASRLVVEGLEQPVDVDACELVRLPAGYKFYMKLTQPATAKFPRTDYYLYGWGKNSHLYRTPWEFYPHLEWLVLRDTRPRTRKCECKYCSGTKQTVITEGLNDLLDSARAQFRRSIRQSHTRPRMTQHDAQASTGTEAPSGPPRTSQAHASGVSVAEPAHGSANLPSDHDPRFNSAMMRGTWKDFLKTPIGMRHFGSSRPVERRMGQGPTFSSNTQGAPSS